MIAYPSAPSQLHVVLAEAKCHAHAVPFSLQVIGAGLTPRRSGSFTAPPECSPPVCGLQRLSALTGLRHLGISGTAVGGDELVALTAALPELRSLEARNAQITDANLLSLPEVTSSHQLHPALQDPLLLSDEGGWLPVTFNRRRQ